MTERKSSAAGGSLPDQIAKKLQAEIIAKHQPGDRLPTVIELARRFAVCKHSITTALEILARAGSITKRQGSGVYVAERKPQRIGILSELNLFDDRVSHYWRAVADGLKSQLAELGAEPHLYVGNVVGDAAQADAPTCRQFWDDAAAGRLDGAVILNVPSTTAWVARVQSCPVPAVGAFTNFEVAPDSLGIMTTGVRCLAAHGCRRVGLLAWQPVESFRQAVRACGLVTTDAWIRSDLDPEVRGAGWDEFREIWTARGDKPDGLLILNDMLFLDAQLVRVPQDLQLVVQTNRGGFPTLRLPAIALEIDPTESAAAFADLLLKRLRGEKLAPTRRLLSFREVTTQADTAADAGCRLSPSLSGNAGDR